MKKLDEVQAYLDNKREIYKKIVHAIDEGLKNGSNKIYLKELKIMDETVDAIAAKADWPECLRKALHFFESTEEYEFCQTCKEILNKIEK